MSPLQEEEKLKDREVDKEKKEGVVVMGSAVSGEEPEPDAPTSASGPGPSEAPQSAPSRDHETTREERARLVAARYAHLEAKVPKVEDAEKRTEGGKEEEDTQMERSVASSSSWQNGSREDSSRSEKQSQTQLPSTSPPPPPSTESHASSGLSFQERENRVMEFLFQCTVKPNPPVGTQYLADLAEELEGEMAEPRLQLSMAERVLMSRIAVFFTSGHAGYLSWASRCYTFCHEDGLRETVQISPLWRKIAGQCGEQLESVRELIVNYSVLSLTCPDVFITSNEPRASGSSTEALLHLVEHCRSPAFFGLLLERLEDEGALESLFIPLFDALYEKLKARTLLNPCADIVGILQNLLSHSSLANIVVQRPYFIPSVARNSLSCFGVTKGCGWVLQRTSLLGLVLQPSPIMSVEIAPGRDTVKARYFSNPMRNPSTFGNLNIVRQEMTAAHNAAHQIFMKLCKGSAQCQLRTLHWVSQLIEGNSRLLQAGTDRLLAALRGRESLLQMDLGVSSVGFALNVVWLLLASAEPIKLNRLEKVDPFLALRTRSYASYADLPSFFAAMVKETKMGDDDAVKTALEFEKTVPPQDPPNFISMVFWLTLRAVKVLMRPTLMQYEQLVTRVQTLQQEGNTTELDAVVPDMLCFNAALFHPRFLALLWRFVKLTECWVLRQAYLHNEDGTINPTIATEIERDVPVGRMSHIILRHPLPPSSPKVPPQFAALPACVLEDLLEVVNLFLSVPQQAGESALPAAEADLDTLAATSLFVLRNVAFVRNPHTRWSMAGQPLVTMQIRQEKMWRHLEQLAAAMECLVPGVIAAFIDAQRAGYYGRIEQRLNYMRMLEDLLEQPAYKGAVRKFGQDQPEEFERFVHMLVDNLSWVLEEAVSTLAEIKKRESSGRPQSAASSSSPSTSLTAANRGMDPDAEEEVPAAAREEGHNVSELPLETLERLCRSLWDGGLRSVRVMQLVCATCSPFILQSAVLLSEVVTSLDFSLDSLVGPRCLALKVSNFQQYNFNPRELLARICEIFICLHSTDQGLGYFRLLKEICSDGRYFKIETFWKANKIVKREGIISTDGANAFTELTARLQEEQNKLNEAEAIFEEVDVPDEFLDPIMQELMEDPVLLPTSSTVMDRKHIERYLMSDAIDPFNRKPLKREELEPQPDLKARIEAFVAETKEKKRTAAADAASQ